MYFWPDGRLSRNSNRVDSLAVVDVLAEWLDGRAGTLASDTTRRSSANEQDCNNLPYTESVDGDFPLAQGLSQGKGVPTVALLPFVRFFIRTV
jgi:hypothetical protein